MNLNEILASILDAAKKLGAEKVLLSRFDIAATSPKMRKLAMDDPFIDRVYPAPDGIEIDEPFVYAIDAVAPGWVIFVGGGSVNFKDLTEFVKKEAA